MEGYEKIVLWCDGLRTLKRKRREIPQTDEDDSDDESRASLKEQKRQDKEQSMVVCFSPMQLRIWSEMVVGEICTRHVHLPRRQWVGSDQHL